MKGLLLVTGGIAVLAFLVIVVGSVLPRQHVASRAIVLQRPIAAVYQTIRDVAAAPSWRGGLETVEILPPRDGRPAFRETTSHGTITYIVDEERAPERLVWRIADEGLPYGGTWTIELKPEGAGTRVRVTENGVVKNPVFRFLARFVFGYTSTIDAYLRDLGRKFGEDVTPAT